MSRYRRSLAQGGSFFFTVNAYRRRPVLTHLDVRAALRAAIADVRHALPFRIDAWVLLPDHLHAITTRSNMGWSRARSIGPIRRSIGM
jgi:putative transposase